MLTNVNISLGEAVSIFKTNAAKLGKYLFYKNNGIEYSTNC